MNSFIQHLLSAYYMPGPFLDAEDTEADKESEIPVLLVKMGDLSDRSWAPANNARSRAWKLGLDPYVCLS